MHIIPVQAGTGLAPQTISPLTLDRNGPRVLFNILIIKLMTTCIQRADWRKLKPDTNLSPHICVM